MEKDEKIFEDVDLEYVYKEYSKDYNEENFYNKIKKYGKKIGITPIYLSFLIFHSIKSKEIPTFMKAPLLGAIGYFVSFIDFLPDLTPIIGYCDDVTIIVSSLVLISTKITPTIREEAKYSTRKIFPNVTNEEFSIIDNMYKKSNNIFENDNKSNAYNSDNKKVKVDIINPNSFDSEKLKFFKRKKS